MKKLLLTLPLLLVTGWSASVLIRAENKLRSLELLEDQMEDDHAAFVRQHLAWRNKVNG